MKKPKIKENKNRKKERKNPIIEDMLRAQTKVGV